MGITKEEMRGTYAICALLYTVYEQYQSYGDGLAKLGEKPIPLGASRVETRRLEKENRDTMRTIDKNAKALMKKIRKFVDVIDNMDKEKAVIFQEVIEESHEFIEAKIEEKFK